MVSPFSLGSAMTRIRDRCRLNSDSAPQATKDSVRYWWVNQNQTYRHEVAGGYLWSPKRNANGRLEPVLRLHARGRARGCGLFIRRHAGSKRSELSASHAYEAPKPLEFGQAGAYWDKIGWRVDVRFTRTPRSDPPVGAHGRPGTAAAAALLAAAAQRQRPSEHLPDPSTLKFAGALADLIGAEARNLVLGHRVAEDAHCNPRSDWSSGKSMR